MSRITLSQPNSSKPEKPPRAGRLSTWALPLLIFALAGVTSAIAASLSVTLIEDASEEAVRAELQEAGLDWAQVDAEGFNVFLIGQAPDEAARFQALTAASSVVEAARVVDQMDVTEAISLAPPSYSLEMLRNESGVQLIGLVPLSTDRSAIVERMSDLAGDGAVADLMETARHPAPATWDASLDYGLRALALLPRSKVSVAEDAVEVIAMAESMQDRSSLMSELSRNRPNGVEVAVDISAPRPLIAPFTLRFVKTESGARLDACSADSEAARVDIVTAARDAGLAGLSVCPIGLGTPSTRWSEAARLAIGAVDQLGGGSVTISDADITLVAMEGADQTLFDDVVGTLENTLPEVFALAATLPETPEKDAEGPPEFTATLSPEGQVVLRGRLASDIARVTTDSFAKAAFSAGRVQMSARVVEGLPSDWSMRVLTGIEVLAKLNQGAVTVQPDDLTLRGVTGNPTASDEITRLLLEKLGQDARFSAEVTYEERLDPEQIPPTPEECKDALLEAKGDRKIKFEPASSDLDAEGRDIMDDIADVLRECGEIPLEIQGHTDSQGSEGGNLRLSQARADAVLTELRNRRVITFSFRAVGYGEATPIADNDTEEGREANRRIEFALIAPEPEADEAEVAAASDEATDADAAPAEDTASDNEAPAAEAAPEAEKATEETDADAAETEDAAEEGLALDDETGSEEPQSE